MKLIYTIKISAGEIFINYKKNYLDNNSDILARNSAPLKSFATIVPAASTINVAGIWSTPYCLAIGSSQPFKLETWYQVNLSFATAAFHFAASSSSETPIIFNPLE